jgi:hypothetical protein
MNERIAELGIELIRCGSLVEPLPGTHEPPSELKANQLFETLLLVILALSAARPNFRGEAVDNAQKHQRHTEISGTSTPTRQTIQHPIHIGEIHVRVVKYFAKVFVFYLGIWKRTVWHCYLNSKLEGLCLRSVNLSGQCTSTNAAAVLLSS